MFSSNIRRYVVSGGACQSRLLRASLLEELGLNSRRTLNKLVLVSDESSPLFHGSDESRSTQSLIDTINVVGVQLMLIEEEDIARHSADGLF
jgi:hypothetical protein